MSLVNDYERRLKKTRRSRDDAKGKLKKASDEAQKEIDLQVTPLRVELVEAQAQAQKYKKLYCDVDDEVRARIEEVNYLQACVSDLSRENSHLLDWKEEVEHQRAERCRAEALLRLAKFKSYLDYKATIRESYLEMNQLKGILDSFVGLKADLGIEVPADYADGLEKERQEKEDWIRGHAKVLITEADLTMPELQDLTLENPTVAALNEPIVEEQTVEDVEARAAGGEEEADKTGEEEAEVEKTGEDGVEANP